MAGWKDFREISAWRLSREVKLRVDVFLEHPEVQRRFRFREQLSDAARSAPGNIAEGFGRFGNKEFARYARIVAAGVEVGDPESVDRFRKAVATPIDQFRSRRGGADGLPATPSEPVLASEPVLPTDPPPA